MIVDIAIDWRTKEVLVDGKEVSVDLLPDVEAELPDKSSDYMAATRGSEEVLGFPVPWFLHTEQVRKGRFLTLIDKERFFTVFRIGLRAIEEVEGDDEGKEALLQTSLHCFLYLYLKLWA